MNVARVGRARALIRPSVAALAPYVPGAQPQGDGWIKLNTNENWFVAPSVLTAIAAVQPMDLRRYPDPNASGVRRRLEALYGVPAAQIICGNGSDEILTLLIRACVGEGDRIAFADPSYSLYQTLADIQHAACVTVPIHDDWSLPVDELLAIDAPLTFVTTPHAPSGVAVPFATLETLATNLTGVVVFDEAYIDFGGQTALPLMNTHPNVVVVRTMSKGFGLAGMRLGFGFGSPEVIDGLNRIKDSYNVDGVAQIAGCAALDAATEYGVINRATIERRDHISAVLRDRFGWSVVASATNFVLATPHDADARAIVERLRTHQILVRHFSHPRLERSLRVSIGSDVEMDRFLTVLEDVVA